MAINIVQRSTVMRFWKILKISMRFKEASRNLYLIFSLHGKKGKKSFPHVLKVLGNLGTLPLKTGLNKIISGVQKICRICSHLDPDSYFSTRKAVQSFSLKHRETKHMGIFGFPPPSSIPLGAASFTSYWLRSRQADIQDR